MTARVAVASERTRRRTIWCRRAYTSIAVTVLIAGHLFAQAQPRVTLLSPQFATDSGVLRFVQGVRALPGGRVLVNDPDRRRLILLDSTLKQVAIVLDTTAGERNSYGRQPGGMIPYLADSTLFLERIGQVFILIDPSGSIIRTVAIPKVQDLNYLMAPSVYGWASVDPKGRLIYQAVRRRPATPVSDPRVRNVPVAEPDSAPIVRADFNTRSVDTIALVGVPLTKVTRSVDSHGVQVGATAIDPLPVRDLWAMTSDGSIALVRAHDYHIDWVRPDGSRESSPKMPFDWKPLTAEDTQRIVDSTRQAEEARRAAMPKPPPSAIGRSAPASPRALLIVEPSDLPDYFPPLRQNAVMADRDGHVWILPTTSAGATGGLLWDVVNRDGRIIQRVRLPLGHRLAGFGPGGDVYTFSSTGPGQTVLHRGRIPR